MPKILTRLRIDEVSSVDRGAGEGVKIMLMKKDKNMSTIAKMFSKVFGGGNDNSVTIDKSIEGLAESITSILGDEKIDKGAALTKTFEQFGDHLKETLTAGPAVVNKEVSTMDIKLFAKALGLAETATETDVCKALSDQFAASVDAIAEMKKMEGDLRIAKAEFTPAELDHYTKAFPPDDDDDEANAKTKAKKAFRLASHTERAAIIKSAEPALPAHIQKMFDDNIAMAKRLADLEAGGSLVALTKQAVDAGLPEAEGATIQKALGGDKAAVEKLVGFVKTAHAAAIAGGVFKEFGSGSGTGVVTTAYDELVVKADQLRKTDSKLTAAAAFAKVYEDPANIEIVKRERGENRPN